MSAWSAALLVSGLLLVGCAPDKADAPVAALSEDDIRRAATSELLRLDWRPEDYRAVLHETDNGWRVEFEPIEPSPPGSDLVVFLSRDGTVTDVFQGE